MDKKILNVNDVFETAKQVSLSAEERASIRMRVALFAAAHPAHVPLRVRFADNVSQFFFGSSSSSYGAIFRPVTAALLVVGCIGAGTSYSAQGALPGDALYPMKININEPIQGVLSVSTQDKVAWKATLTERRLEEAEDLAAVGRLTPEVSQRISESISEAANDFNTRMASLAQVPQNDAIIASAQSNMEASFNVHEDVLSHLGTDAPIVGAAINPILSNVKAHASSTRAARSRAEAILESHGGEEIKNAAREKKHAAQDAIKMIQTQSPQSVIILAATTTDENLNVAEKSFKDADKQLEEGKFGGAFGAFQASIRAAQEAQMGADARDRIQRKIRSGDHGLRGGSKQKDQVSRADSSGDTSTKNQTDTSKSDHRAENGRKNKDD